MRCVGEVYGGVGEGSGEGGLKTLLMVTQAEENEQERRGGEGQKGRKVKEEGRTSLTHTRETKRNTERETNYKSTCTNHPVRPSVRPFVHPSVPCTR